MCAAGSFFDSSGTSWGARVTESDRDLDSNFFLLCSSPSGNSSVPLGEEPFPMKPLLTILVTPLFVGADTVCTAVRGVPGDVGGLARGAELMECAPRLWVCD